MSSYVKYENQMIDSLLTKHSHTSRLNMKKTIISKAVSAAFILTYAGQAYAEEPETKKEDSGLFEVIEVTATKRSESIQSVPVSVSALSGGQLDALGLSDNSEITQQIPNFQVNAWSPQITIFNLRGVSQNNYVDNLEAPIAVYQDEVYIASMNAISGQMFDIERVEVLRGPQGTLFGRNATGGLVHYISAGAKDDYTNGYFDITIGSNNKQSFEGAIGGEIADNVRGRFAFRNESSDGYIEPINDPSVDQRAIGGSDGYGLRGTIEVDFSDTLVGQFIVKHSKDDDVPTGGYVLENCDFDADGFCPTDDNGRAIVTGGVTSGDPHKHSSDTRGYLNRESNSYTAKFTKDFDGFEFVSVTNFMDMDKEYLEDGDAVPDPVVVFGQDSEVSQFTQEFRLSGDSGALKWQIGAYYMDYEMDAYAITTGAPNIDLSFALWEEGMIEAPTVFDDNPFDGHSDRYYNMTVENMSVFGQIDYDLTEQTTLTAGLRYSKDEKEMNWVALFTSEQQTTPLVYAATESNSNYSNDILNQFKDDSIDYDDYAARLSLKHQFNSDIMGFVSWNRGIKGGNWSLASAVSPERFTHDPEVLNSYEVGFKASLTESTRLNGTVYYYDYTDYQTFVAIPPGGNSPNPQVGNSDATSYGGEFELVSSLTDNLDVMLGIAFSQSEVELVEAGANPIENAELPNAPKFSGNYLIRHYTELKDANIVLQLDGAFYDDQFLELTNGPGTQQDAYNVTNISINYSTESWDVSVYAKNIFDETYKAYSLDLGMLGATTYYAPGSTFGASFRYDFE